MSMTSHPKKVRRQQKAMAAVEQNEIAAQSGAPPSVVPQPVIESDQFPYVPFFQFFDSGANKLSFWGFVDWVKVSETQSSEPKK